MAFCLGVDTAALEQTSLPRFVALIEELVDAADDDIYVDLPSNAPEAEDYAQRVARVQELLMQTRAYLKLFKGRHSG